MAEYDRLTVTVYSANERILLRGKVQNISRFHLIQDYTITLDGGQTIVVNSGAVELMALEWISQHKDLAIAALDGKETQPKRKHGCGTCGRYQHGCPHTTDEVVSNGYETDCPSFQYRRVRPWDDPMR